MFLDLQVPYVGNTYERYPLGPFSIIKHRFLATKTLVVAALSPETKRLTQASGVCMECLNFTIKMSFYLI